MRHLGNLQDLTRSNRQPAPGGRESLRPCANSYGRFRVPDNASRTRTLQLDGFRDRHGG